MIETALTMLAMMVAAQAPQDAEPPIVAQSMPAIVEPSWSFVDGGALYLIGKQSGSVTIIRADGRPRPSPAPQPPPVVVKPVAWATLVLSAEMLTPEMAALRTDQEIRKTAADKKIVFRSYLDSESDIDRLNFRPFLSKELSLPTLILQAADGAVIQAKTVKTSQDVLNSIK